ncbi:unnamed protein product [Rhizophagus irregularis]|nr:unnamed protein product [Rhizophagus irregularis]
MELEENQEIVLWGWGWEEIGLTLLIHMVLANRTNPLMKKKWQEVVFVAIIVELMKIKLLKDMFLLIIFTSLMIGIILKSLRGKSTWQGIVLAIIVGLLMESNLLINMFAPTVICHFLIKIKIRLSLKLNKGEIIALTILNGLLIKSSMWIEMGLIIMICLLIKIYLRIRRMIKTDHNLNIDERKTKYRDHEVICEKNWRHKISKYYCEDCFKEETDDREKNRLQFGISEGGFAKVYSANWMDAYIKGWDQKTKNWRRKERKKVALKVLKDSSKDISKTFLNELEALVKLAELDNSKLDYKTIEDVYSTFLSLSSRSQANYKSRLLDLPDLSELESELAPDSMQISTGEIES